MSSLAVPTDNEFTDAGDLKPLVCTLIADVKKRKIDPWFTLPEFGVDNDSTSYFFPLPIRHDSGYRPMALDGLAKELESIADPLSSMVVYVPVASVPSTATQMGVTARPAWQPQIDAASTHEEIVAMLRLFGLAAVADRLIYLRCLADDDPEEPSIEIESLRALAYFLMSERQLPDPQIGVTPNGFIQIEWPVRGSGILAMELLPSSLIRFAAISGPARLGDERLRVNGTLPKDNALAAIQLFSSQLESR